MSTGRYLTPKQVAELLQVSKTTVYQWIAAGDLAALNVGTPGKRPSWRVLESSICNLRVRDVPDTPRVDNPFGIRL